MRTFLSFLPAVACLAMMLFICGPMMLKMMRNKSSGETEAQLPSPDTPDLRDEVASLRAKLALREKEDVERQL